MKRWISIFVVSLMLFGCGTKFIYNNLDWIAIRYIEDFVVLNDEQRDQVSRAISQASDWHRLTELPLYIAQLNQLLAINPMTFSEDQLTVQERRLRHHSLRLLDQLFPMLVAIVAQMDDDQTEQFMNTLRVRHVKYKRKYAKYSEDDLRAMYQQRIEDSLVNWLGPLSEAQQALTARWASELMITTPLWFDYQTQLRVELLQMFAIRHDKEGLENGLHDLLYQPQQYYSAELERRITHNAQIGHEYLLEIINVMTPKQTQVFRQEVSEWRDVAIELTL